MRSYFSIKTQFDNVGDALINRELVSLARQYGKVVVDLSRAPKRFQETMQLAAADDVILVHGFLSFVKDMVLARLRKDPCVYFTTPGGISGEISRLAFVKGMCALIVLTAFRWLGVRIYSFGASFERLGSRHAFLWRLRRRVISKLFPRDLDSARYLDTIGISVDGDSPDLAFNLFSSKDYENEASLGLSFRGDQHREQSEEVRRLVGRLAQNPDVNVVIIVVQVARDMSLARILAEDISAFGKSVEVVDASASIEECLASYHKIDTLYSNRLHALLMAGSQGVKIVPCVSGGYNQKIIGIFEGLGVGAHIHNLDQADTLPDEVSILEGGVQQSALLKATFDAAIKAVDH